MRKSAVGSSRGNWKVTKLGGIQTSTPPNKLILLEKVHIIEAFDITPIANLIALRRKHMNIFSQTDTLIIMF